MEYTARVDGIPQWRNAMRETLRALDGASRRATTDGANLVERETKLILRLKSHRPGTPTPSQPGEPPALITGFLARSNETRPARRAGPFQWRSQSGPTAVYSRIHELGGWTGPGHRIYLPPRPYMRPVNERVRGPIHDHYQRRWAEVLER